MAGSVTLISGHRIGPYEVTGMIGAGGMGEVYRAHDSRLNRDVALKVLASLNHQNIAAIHGLEEDLRDRGSRTALVLELRHEENITDTRNLCTAPRFRFHSECTDHVRPPLRPAAAVAPRVPCAAAARAGLR